LSSDTIELAIRGQINGINYGKDTLDRNNTSAHFSFRTRTSKSMLFINATVEGNWINVYYSLVVLKEDTKEVWDLLVIDKVILSTW
jgi:hypothetical protein